MEANDRGGRDFRKTEQRFTDRLAYISIDRYCCECLSPLREPSLVILRDVDSSFTQQSTHPTDYTRNVGVREDEERISRLYIDVKGADPREPWQRAGLRRSRNRNLPHSAAQSNFNSVRIVLC
jgi:hypothetical protein